MKESVSQKTAKTSFWTAIERFSNLGINLIVQLLLARMLNPSDFGVIAMMTVFIGISQAVSECGVTNALIRKKDCSQQDYSTAFYLNLGISIVLYIIIYILSPYISAFYNMPIVEKLLKVYSLVFILEALRIVQYSKLCKKLDFKSIGIISSSSVFISGLIGLGLAWEGYGAWALIMQVLSAAFFYLFLIQFKVKWYPNFCFDKQSFKYLWEFGSKMLLTGIISRVYSNIYNLVIGKAFSSATLGLFNNGQKYAQFYPNLVDSIFVKNSLPILSEFQDNDERLRDLYRKYIQLVCFLTFPVCFVVFALAEPIIIILFTEKWIEAVPYLKIFAITALLIPANSINLNMLQVKGRTDYTLKAEVLKKGVGFLLVFLLIPLGPFFLAIGSSIISVVAYAVNVYYAKKLLGLSIIQQTKDIGEILISSILPLLVILYLKKYIVSDSLTLIYCSLVFLVLFCFMAKFIVHIPVFDQIVNVIKKIR